MVSVYCKSSFKRILFFRKKTKLQSLLYSIGALKTGTFMREGIVTCHKRYYEIFFKKYPKKEIIDNLKNKSWIIFW
jgi:hypothetical protein